MSDAAHELLRLHLAPEILVLVNVWDAASARTVAALPGCRAIATASWSIAAARGLPDDESIGRDAMLAAVAEIVRAVEPPVTADLQAGFGAAPAEVAETVRRAVSIGVVGCNLEDAGRTAGEGAERIVAARAAAGAEGVGMVINARTDVRLGVGDALARGRAYVEAGADCVFVLHARERADIAALVSGMGAPVSVLARPGMPSVAELQALGVARVSFGPGPLGVALAALDRAGRELLAGGAPPAELGFSPSSG